MVRQRSLQDSGPIHRRTDRQTDNPMDYPLDYRSLTLSTFTWFSASSVEIVIIIFLVPVFHCWTLELYFLTSILSFAFSCSLNTLGACNCCVVRLYFSDLQLMYSSSMFENICIDGQASRQTDRQTDCCIDFKL